MLKFVNEWSNVWAEFITHNDCFLSGYPLL